MCHDTFKTNLSRESKYRKEFFFHFLVVTHTNEHADVNNVAL